MSSDWFACILVISFNFSRIFMKSVRESNYSVLFLLGQGSCHQCVPQNLKNERIPFNHAVNSIILKNFTLRQNDPETGTIFSRSPLISFKRDNNISNFLIRSVLKSDNQPGSFKCTRTRCKTYPFIHNVDKISGHKRSIKITDRFTCTSVNVIYCIKCTLYKHLYMHW